MSMYRTYQSELFDKEIPLTKENEFIERKHVANWLVQHANWNINKYDTSISMTITFKEAFEHFKNRIETSLPELQRADNWDDYIDIIRNVDKKRPITKLENIAIQYMKKTKQIPPSPPLRPTIQTNMIIPSSETRTNTPTSANRTNPSNISFVEIEGNSDKYLYTNAFTSSTKLTQFIYIGSKDEKNDDIGIVKTLYSNVRDQEFENTWYETNKKAKLFCIKHECYVPVSKIAIWDTKKDILPEKQSFLKFVSSLEPEKPIDKIEKYIKIAVNQLEDYLELDEDDKEGTLTQKYINYMKKYINSDNEDEAIKEMKKLSEVEQPPPSKKRKVEDNKSTPTPTTLVTSTSSRRAIMGFKSLDYEDPSTLDYTQDEDDLEQNRFNWKNNLTKGYLVLNETNNDYAPFGYNDDLTERIAPFGFIKNDPTNRARKKKNTV